jgi:hypothetical protein
VDEILIKLGSEAHLTRRYDALESNFYEAATGQAAFLGFLDKLDKLDN